MHASVPTRANEREPVLSPKLVQFLAPEVLEQLVTALQQIKADDSLIAMAEQLVREAKERAEESRSRDLNTTAARIVSQATR